MFLGVPHKGADNAWWKNVPGSLVKITTIGFKGNTNFIQSISRSSHIWRDIAMDFVPRTSDLVATHSFFETRTVT